MFYGVSYGYDANGNQTSRGNDTFSYDHENRLTQTVIGGATSSSIYNGDGLRLSHTVSGLTTNYSWDVASGLPVVLQDGTNTYVYGLDLISATDGTGAQTYFLYDGLGSTTNLADGAGNSAGSYGYDVFGAVRSRTSGGSNYWLFTGEQRDGDSGLYFLRARYYDPATGRFVGQDPMPFINRYSYVGNNPVNLVDPYGLFGCGPVSVICNTVDHFWDAMKCMSNPRCLANKGINFIPEVELFGRSGQLWATCVLYPDKCAGVYSLAYYANWETQRVYGGQAYEGTFKDPSAGDAFQHCFWSGLLTIAYGSDFAKDITSRYEAVPDNNPEQRAYDLENNRRGRDFAKKMRFDPRATSRLHNYCQQN